MKKLICMMLAIIVFCSITSPQVEAKTAKKKTDYQIVKMLVKTTHKPIKLVTYHNKKTDYIISHRKGKNYTVVEKVISISNGNKGGWTFDGCYIAYNKKVPRNRLVTSYVIYDSNSNEFDEILWVVDNKTYR